MAKLIITIPIAANLPTTNMQVAKQVVYQFVRETLKKLPIQNAFDIEKVECKLE
jgi:hypothetical protein